MCISEHQARRDICCDGVYYEPDDRCERATFSMACFWAPEAVFGVQEGVLRTRVGYAGLGTMSNPTYKNIFDYTETVDVEWDPLKTKYEKLLDAFWKHHDPTAVCSRQYMSIIYYHNPEQRTLAEASLRKQVGLRARPIKTQIYPAKEFYEAEDYHQKYFLQKYPYILNMLDMKVGLTLKRSKNAARLNGFVAGFAPPQQFEDEWRRMGLCCEVVDYVRLIIKKNYKPYLGCAPH